MKAIRFACTGGPEVLEPEDRPLPEPGPGQVRVRHTAIGVNFIDTYHRTGLYPLPLPSGLGLEAAGIVEALGPNVRTRTIGERVAYCSGPPGAYAQAHAVPADRLVPVPDGVSDAVAAASLLKGLTAWFLIHRTHQVQRGETILVHAAAGGVGRILCQWARAKGARVIGAVGSAAKEAIARDSGAAGTVVTADPGWPQAVRTLTDGRGVPVVYDSVGAATFSGSLDCLAPRGLMVSFGNASGPPPKLDLLTLAAKGSLFITRPTLGTYVADPADLAEGAAALWTVIGSGSVQIAPPAEYPLEEAARAHRDLEGRATTGSLILRP